MRVFFAGKRAEVGDGLVAGDVIEAVLDEVGLLHAGQLEAGLLAGELGLHGGESGVRGRALAVCNSGGYA